MRGITVAIHGEVESQLMADEQTRPKAPSRLTSRFAAEPREEQRQTPYNPTNMISFIQQIRSHYTTT